MPYYPGDSIDLVMLLDVTGATVTATVKNASGEQVGDAITMTESGISSDGKRRYAGVYRSPVDDLAGEHTAIAVAVKGADRKTVKTWFPISEL